MKPPKSYLDAFGREQKDVRTDRVAKLLVEEAAAERREKSRLLKKARLERDAQDGHEERTDQARDHDELPHEG